MTRASNCISSRSHRRQNAAPPAWSELTEAQLQLWHVASLRADFAGPAYQWFVFFHVHGRDREPAALWEEVLVPWARDENAPLHALLFVAMLRRVFDKPTTWSTLWKFAREHLVRDGAYLPLRERRSRGRRHVLRSPLSPVLRCPS